MIRNLRFFCQRVLPVVYDDSLSFQELLYKVVCKINEIVPIVNKTSETITEEIRAILTEWLEDGTFAEIINQELLENVESRVDFLEKSPEMISNVKVTPLIYQDGNSGSYQGMTADADNNLLYVYQTGTFPYGTIHVYNTGNVSEVMSYQNMLGYHGNDLEKVGDTIYIAQCYKTNQVLDGNELLAFNLTNQVTASIHTFPTAAIIGVASINDNELLITGMPNYSAENVADYTFYRYDIAADLAYPVTMNGAGSPNFVAGQGTYFDRDRNVFYILASGPDMILVFDYDPDTGLKFKSLCPIQKRDSNGINCGEFEGLATFNGKDMYLSYIFKDDYSVSPYSLGVGLINMYTGNPWYPIAYNWHESLNTDLMCYCDSNYTGLLELGTESHPFKTFGRAVEALNFAERFRQIVLAGGSYGTCELRNRKVNAVIRGGNASFTGLSFILCDLSIIGDTGRLVLSGKLRLSESRGDIFKITTSKDIYIQNGCTVVLNDIISTVSNDYPVTVEGSIASVLLASSNTYQGYKLACSGGSLVWVNQYIDDTEVYGPGTNWSVIRGGTVINP